MNGARPSQNQLSINGIGNVDTGNNGGMNVTVSIDSIAEFKILTGSYQAEYGRSVGGQITVVTKSGTDQFHGSGYWYHRNDSLNANTFLNNVRGLAKPLFRYNDPGYTIGGPIYIPQVLERARHKVFFFFSQEWQRQLSPNTAKNVLVPTALERKGDFSQSLNNNGQKLTFINDPLTQTPFPGMVVPANRIYAPGQALLNIFPLPNVDSGLELQLHLAASRRGAAPRNAPAAGLQRHRQHSRLRALDRQPAAHRRALRLVCARLDGTDHADCQSDSRPQLRRRHDLDHQPHDDQRVQLGLHPQLDSHRRNRQCAATHERRHQPAGALSHGRAGRLHSRTSPSTARASAPAPGSAPATRRSSTTTPPSTSATT